MPSVIASEEKNLILNPAHERFAEVRMLSKQRVKLDIRATQSALPFASIAICGSNASFRLSFGMGVAPYC